MDVAPKGLPVCLGSPFGATMLLQFHSRGSLRSPLAISGDPFGVQNTPVAGVAGGDKPHALN